MKKLFAFVSILALGVTLAACSTGDLDAKESTYLTLDINPSVEFIVDEDGEIESYTALNEDGEVVIADLDLEGMDYEEALDTYLEEATDLGYIDVNADDNAVYISTNEDDEETEDTEEGDTEEGDTEEGDTEEGDNEDSEGSLEDRVKEKVNEHFKSRGILGAAAEKDLEEEYGDLAKEYDIGLGKARLISRAVELDEELTFEEAVEMDMSEIMSILRADHRERIEEFRSERKEQAQAFKNSMKDEMRDQVQKHRDEVEEKRESGEEVGSANFDAIMERIQNRTEQEESSTRERMEGIKDKVRGKMGGNNPFFSNDENDTEDDEDTEE
ncbi:MAG: anti-sigma-I factor RsgI family protein [Bacillota bacterium]